MRGAFRHVILPLSKPATFTVILLSFIGGLRTFDLIWTMTGGGPGFTTDVLASTIFKHYQAGFYGLSTAGNVILFILVTPRLPVELVPPRRELTSGAGPALLARRRRRPRRSSCSSFPSPSSP